MADDIETKVLRARLARSADVAVAVAALCLLRLPTSGFAQRLALAVVGACILLVALAGIRVLLVRAEVPRVGMAPATIITVSALVTAIYSAVFLLADKHAPTLLLAVVGYLIALAAVLIGREDERTWPTEAMGWVHLIVYPAVGAVVGTAPLIIFAPILAHM